MHTLLVSLQHAFGIFNCKARFYCSCLLAGVGGGGGAAAAVTDTMVLMSRFLFQFSVLSCYYS